MGKERLIRLVSTHLSRAIIMSVIGPQKRPTINVAIICLKPKVIRQAVIPALNHDIGIHHRDWVMESTDPTIKIIPSMTRAIRTLFLGSINKSV